VSSRGLHIDLRVAAGSEYVTGCRHNVAFNGTRFLLPRLQLAPRRVCCVVDYPDVEPAKRGCRNVAARASNPCLTAKGRVWPMLMAPAEEACGYVQNTKEKAAAEADVGASGSGAIQSCGPEQPPKVSKANRKLRCGPVGTGGG
jgi:hypothetical protein